jgi:S-formylglutathione hydrolase FrmB
MRIRRRRLLAALAALASVVLAVPATPADATTVPELPNRDGYGIEPLGDLISVGRSQGEDWLLDATMTSTAVFVPGPSGSAPTVTPLARELHVRILLPDNYNQADTATRYPVLYLLHGGSDTYASWTDKGNVRARVNQNRKDAFDGIVVMPEGGRSGWYSDWEGETDGHFRPQWETYHVNQLVPWIDANFNTIADRSGRAIAGVSMGGFGAMRYAARHPHLFGAAASFSGAVELRHEPFQDTISNSMWYYGATVVNQGLWNPDYRITTGEPPEAEETSRLRMLFGPSSTPTAPETRPGWPNQNPVELAAAGAFATTNKLALYAGTSLRAFDNGEKDIAIMTDALHEALRDRSVPHRYCRGYGTHDWPYWENDLLDFLQYVWGTTPATCTRNGLDTPETDDDWSPVP